MIKDDDVETKMTVHNVTVHNLKSVRVRACARACMCACECVFSVCSLGRLNLKKADYFMRLEISSKEHCLETCRERGGADWCLYTLFTSQHLADNIFTSYFKKNEQKH